MVRSPSGTSWVHASKRYTLDRSYTIWFQHAQHTKKKPKSEQQYEEGLQCIGTFNSVQDFWRYWNAIDLQKMPNFCTLSVFKHPIKPMWEDPHNKEGGQWILRCVDRSQTPDFFTKLALALIGGYFECHEDLCGVVLSMKPKFNSISLWNCQVEPSLCGPVESELQELLGHDSKDTSLSIEYKEHGGAIVTNCIKRREAPDGLMGEAASSLVKVATEPRRLAPSWMQTASTTVGMAKAATVVQASGSRSTNSTLTKSSGSALKATAAPFHYNAASTSAYSGYSNEYSGGASADYQYGQSSTGSGNGNHYDYYGSGYAYYGSGDYADYASSGTYYTTGTGEEQLWTGQ
jgi:translation initiation factor 4E